MPVRLTVCDSGGEDGVTSRAYEFHRYLVSRRLAGKFRLVKGASSRNAPRVLQTYPDAKAAGKKAASVGDVPVLMLNTTELKDTVASDLARESIGPGYWHFPQWLPTSFYEELTAEERGANGWVKVGGKNESVDLCAYGEAAFVWLGGDKIKWDAPPSWAADWDSNPDVSIDGIAPPPPQITRRPASYLAR